MVGARRAPTAVMHETPIQTARAFHWRLVLASRTSRQAAFGGPNRTAASLFVIFVIFVAENPTPFAFVSSFLL